MFGFFGSVIRFMVLNRFQVSVISVILVDCRNKIIRIEPIEKSIIIFILIIYFILFKYIQNEISFLLSNTALLSFLFFSHINFQLFIFPKNFISQNLQTLYPFDFFNSLLVQFKSKPFSNFSKFVASISSLCFMHFVTAPSHQFFRSSFIGCSSLFLPLWV